MKILRFEFVLIFCSVLLIGCKERAESTDITTDLINEKVSAPITFSKSRY